MVWLILIVRTLSKHNHSDVDNQQLPDSTCLHIQPPNESRASLRVAWRRSSQHLNETTERQGLLSTWAISPIFFTSSMLAGSAMSIMSVISPRTSKVLGLHHDSYRGLAETPRVDGCFQRRVIQKTGVHCVACLIISMRGGDHLRRLLNHEAVATVRTIRTSRCLRLYAFHQVGHEPRNVLQEIDPLLRLAIDGSLLWTVTGCNEHHQPC